MKRQARGITLIALVITIIILLILAGISISTLGGENGLFAKTKQAQKIHIKAEMKENLILVINELQIEKEGNATLDDVTQEYMENKLTQYEVTVTTDASVDGKIVTLKKSAVVGKFLIDEKLNIVELDLSGVDITYKALSRNENNIETEITIMSVDSGIKQIQMPNGNIENGNGKKEIKINYTVQLEKEYTIKVILEDGTEKEQKIKIDNYFYNITKNLEEGITLDNATIKAAYNKPYQATLMVEGDYILNKLIVKMGAQEITTSGNNIVDKTTGKITIEKVTDDIEIIAKAKKLEIGITTPIINTSITATNSLGSATQTKGTTLYINFKATIEGTNCTVKPEIPYAVTKNGTYQFTVTGIYQEKTITKEIEIKVNQYKSAQNLVQYDAGDWTKEEIEELKKQCLYELNYNRKTNAKYKLNDPENENALGFTFGGFTYKGDPENASLINDGKIITSRNQSIPRNTSGLPSYDGWQILEIKDSEGSIITDPNRINNVINNKTENEKIYVTRLIHAGCPETFVCCSDGAGTAQRAIYILSSGLQYPSSNKINGNTINPRLWDMYKDSELDEKGYISGVKVTNVITGQNYPAYHTLTGNNQYTSPHPSIARPIPNYSGEFIFKIRTNRRKFE